jgi:hypothetical protein
MQLDWPALWLLPPSAVFSGPEQLISISHSNLDPAEQDSDPLFPVPASSQDVDTHAAIANNNPIFFIVFLLIFTRKQDAYRLLN